MAKKNKTKKQAEKGTWIESPLTKREEVMVENDAKNGLCKFCIGSGYFTNEYPLNYKKNKDFDLKGFEKNMPKLMKDLRFDDGDSYWYPTTIRTKDAMVLPVGDSTENWRWAYVKIVPLTKEELKNELSKNDSKLDMDNAQYFERFIDASKLVNGVSLDVLP